MCARRLRVRAWLAAVAASAVARGGSIRVLVAALDFFHGSFQGVWKGVQVDRPVVQVFPFFSPCGTSRKGRVSLIVSGCTVQCVSEVGA